MGLLTTSKWLKRCDFNSLFCEELLRLLELYSYLSSKCLIDPVTSADQRLQENKESCLASSSIKIDVSVYKFNCFV